jgi:hypothetical protein
MLNKELKELVIAITMLIEAKAANMTIETEYGKVRLKDFIKHLESQRLKLSGDDMSWPDDFEEDWE